MSGAERELSTNRDVLSALSVAGRPQFSEAGVMPEHAGAARFSGFMLFETHGIDFRTEFVSSSDRFVQYMQKVFRPGDSVQNILFLEAGGNSRGNGANTRLNELAKQNNNNFLLAFAQLPAYLKFKFPSREELQDAEKTFLELVVCSRNAVHLAALLGAASRLANTGYNIKLVLEKPTFGQEGKNLELNTASLRSVDDYKTGMRVFKATAIDKRDTTIASQIAEIAQMAKKRKDGVRTIFMGALGTLHYGLIHKLPPDVATAMEFEINRDSIGKNAFNQILAALINNEEVSDELWEKGFQEEKLHKQM